MTIGGYRLRRATLLAIVIVALGTVTAWAALKDVANRLQPAPAAQQAPASTTTPEHSSSFSPGPQLGDLRGLLASAEVASTEETVEDGSSGSGSSSVNRGRNRVSVRGDAQVVIINGSSSSGSSGSVSRSNSHGSGSSPRSPRSPRGGQQLCNMPAMC